MLPFIAEFLGTMLLIILGDGVVANVTLNKSGMKGAGSIQITIAWGLAVMVPAFIFGAASGAHFNPALTLALAVDGSLAWGLVPGYILCQFAGAFVGAVIVYLMFKDQFDATEEAGTKLGVFSTGPSIPNLPRNIFCSALSLASLTLLACSAFFVCVASFFALSFSASFTSAGVGRVPQLDFQKVTQAMGICHSSTAS